MCGFHGDIPNCLILKRTKMTHFRKKIPALKDGMAKMIMQLLFQKLRSQKGLTKFVEENGVNGKWLKIEEPMDIPVSKLFKILQHKAQYQTKDEFLEDWNSAGRALLLRVRKEKRRKV